MREGLNFNHMLTRMELPGEVPLRTSLIEMIGNSRVLIENQKGICCYSRCNITVKVHRGSVCIAGEDLELRQMSHSNLVITGVIHSISLTDWS